MNLALKYRPQTFDEVVGQKANSVILIAMVANNSLSQALLFTGPSGVGKTSMARIIAAELNPDAKDDVHKGIHPSVLEIDAASNGSVDRIRQLKKDIRHVVPGHRVIILDEAHAISPEGFAALLNILEHVPEGVTFILITTEAHKIPKTIRHRCEHYAFKRANIEDIVTRLRFIADSEQIEVDNDLLNLLAHSAEGSYRESCMLLRQIWIGGIKTVESYNKLHQQPDFGPILIKSALSGPISALNQLDVALRTAQTEDILDKTVQTLSDLMVLKGGIQLDYSGYALQLREDLAAKLPVDKILKGLKIIWETQTKLGNIDSIRNLQLVFSLLGEALQVENTAVKAEMPVRSSTTMTFAQMRQSAS